MWRLTRDAINRGTSLIVFPEGKRTRDGHVTEFQDGAFRVAQQLEIPVVPVSIVGSFKHHRTGHWMFWPTEIRVFLHASIDTTGFNKEDVPALRDRVKKTIEGPIKEFLAELTETQQEPTEQEVTN
jgi:1-acyl-sn-glycerol-3-phosphate acyltransferase